MPQLELPWIAGDIVRYSQPQAAVTNVLNACNRAKHRELETEIMNIFNLEIRDERAIYGITLNHGHSLYVLFSGDSATFGLTLENSV